MLEQPEKRRAQIIKEVEEVIQSIPLEKLSMEYTPIARRLAWRAPKDQGFKIRGCFEIRVDGEPDVLYTPTCPLSPVRT